MTGNDFYDPDTDSTFRMMPNLISQRPDFWQRAEPIWSVAERQGKRTGMFWWDG